MTSKEIKTILKSAKEAIQAKNYVAAVEYCDTILAKEPENYHALVFLGVAHENTNNDEKCIEAYTRATELLPDQALAWQGLVSYYEKNNTTLNLTKLVSVYEKLIEIIKDDERYINIQLKLAKLHVQLRNEDKALNTLTNVLSRTSSSKVNEVNTSVHNIILKIVVSKCNNLHITYKGSMEYFLFNNLHCESADQNSLCSLYLDIIYNENAVEMISICNKLIDCSVSSVVPLETVLCIFLERNIVLGEDISENTDDIMKNIECTAPDSRILQAWRAHQFFCAKKFNEARELISKWTDSNLIVMHLITIETDAGLHDVKAVTSNVEKVIEQLPSLRIYSDEKSIRKMLMLWQVDALLQEKDTDSLRKAGQVCKQLKTEHDCLEVDIALCYLFLVLRNHETAGKICKKLSGESSAELAVLGWYYHCMDQLELAKDNLEKAVYQVPDEAQYMYQLAQVYWKLIREKSMPHKQCMTMLMKAAKADPYRCNTFFWLGRYFEKYSQDLEKAHRCYRKAYDLKPNNETAAEYLVNILEKLGREDEMIEILKAVTEMAIAGGSKWAWLRLGLCLVKPDASAAIQCFQSAIRADPNDAYCWQCLADGYMNRGSYNAAMKTFTKASELDPTCMYNLVQLANIKLMLGLHLDAVEDYKKILVASEDYVPALKGLAETHISMAKEAMEKFYSLKAVDNSSLAINYLTRAANKRPDLALIWKLIGDACSIIAEVPKSMVKMTVPSKLCDERTDKEVGLVEILEIGSRAYIRALKISNEDSVIWYDLGINYYYQAKVTGERKRLEKVTNCLKKSLYLNSSDTQTWSTLGVVLVLLGEKAEAQHCFIQALELDSQNAQAWTNLGILYLTNDNVKLAHEAFKMAQSMEPEYVNGWIGQAMVAETVNHIETDDLYRHCTELSLHEEAALGYSHWITHSLLEGHEIADCALLNATTCLTRYLDRYSDDAVALNMLGLLLKRLGLYNTAVQVLRLAVQHSKDEYTSLTARANLARLLCKTGDYDSALSEYRRLENCHIPQGYASFKAGEYQEAFQQYRKALDADNGEHSQDISIMLGLCAYWLGDIDEAKTRLFACVQEVKPLVQGLLSLSAVSLLKEDMTLASAVIQELEKHITKEFVVDISKLTVMCHVLNNELDEAVRFLQQQIETFPDRVELSLLLVKVYGQKGSEFPDIELQKGDPNSFYSLSQIYFISGKHDLAFKFAHRAVMCYPNQTRKWIALAHATISSILHCYDFARCQRKVSGIDRIMALFYGAEEHKELRFFVSTLLEFIGKLVEIPISLSDDVDFLVEMIDRHNAVIVEGENGEFETIPGRKIDGRAVILHGFIEIVAIALKLQRLSGSSIDNDIVKFYETCGVYEYDQNVFSRDESIHIRKCTIRKDSSGKNAVKFPRLGLNCRARCLAYSAYCHVFEVKTL